MFELSYSKARAYLNCPWLYKLKYLDEWKAPPSPQASLGLSVHKALERYHLKQKFLDDPLSLPSPSRGEGKGEGGPRGEEAILAALDDVWDRAGYANSGQELEFYDRAQLMLKSYVSEIESKWNGKVFFVEKEFFLDLPQAGMKLRGILDRVDQMPDGSYALVEYKTHAVQWSEERLKDDLQVTVYNHAAQEALGLAGIRLFFFFVSQGKIVEVIRGHEDWAKAVEILNQVKAGVLSRKFDPDTSYCPHCEMNKNCRYSTVRKGG
ncbi:MAG: PD-(D/E)XK nuclease family protein [Elusimicrobia bacterium]|nr:PD-(D/E)XK nuclease family protein [Elusimicrobiota bacterium]